MTPGQAAYEMWCARVNEPRLKSIKGLDLQPWESMTLFQKSIWESVAEAAIKCAAEKKT